LLVAEECIPELLGEAVSLFVAEWHIPALLAEAGEASVAEEACTVERPFAEEAHSAEHRMVATRLDPVEAHTAEKPFAEEAHAAERPVAAAYLDPDRPFQGADHTAEETLVAVHTLERAAEVVEVVELVKLEPGQQLPSVSSSPPWTASEVSPAQRDPSTHVCGTSFQGPRSAFSSRHLKREKLKPAAAQASEAGMHLAVGLGEECL
jgi:hypothetical protein